MLILRPTPTQSNSTAGLNLQDDQGICAEHSIQRLAIVRAIVALAKNLGFTVTAEGIETLEQARILSNLECDLLQGYYISKPVRAAEILPLLERHWMLGVPTEPQV